MKNLKINKFWKKDIKWKIYNATQKVLLIASLGTLIGASSLDKPKESYELDLGLTDIEKEYCEEVDRVLNTMDKTTFTNKDLEDYLISNYYIDKIPLDQITEIEIDGTYLKNNDLSDLKNLVRLTQLCIKNMNFNCKDLEYCPNILGISFVKCTINNTTYLPNNITYMNTVACNITDDRFIFPYFLKNLKMFYTNSTNITLKTNNNLENFAYNGSCVLDLSFLKDTSLKEIELLNSSNIKNPEILKTLPLEKITIDDYAPIWMNMDLYHSLNISNESIKKEISQIDEIYNSIIDESNTEEEIIASISKYLIEKIDYDPKAIVENHNSPEFNDLVKNYNLHPIFEALNGKYGLCINYSTLFQALSNRAGLDCIVMDSLNHSWNLINDERYIDITSVDGLTITSNKHPTNEDIKKWIDEGNNKELYFYDFRENTYNNEKLKPMNYVEQKEIDINEKINKGYFPEYMIYDCFKYYKNQEKVIKLKTIEYISILILVCFSLLKEYRKHTLINKEFTLK